MHLHAAVHSIDVWAKRGMKMTEFAGTVEGIYHDMGFEPEFERDLEKSAWLPADCATILSGSFTYDGSAFRWHPMSATKLLKTKVPPSQVYPNKTEPLAWMLGAFSTALPFRRDPFWNDLFVAYERFAETRGVDLAAARERWVVQNRNMDGLNLQQGGLLVIPDRWMLEKLERLALVRGIAFDAADWQSTRMALRSVEDFPCQLDTPSLDWYRQIHYGVYEV